MKKLPIIFLILISVFLSACASKRAEYSDFVSGDPSDIYGNPIMETEDGFYANLYRSELALCFYDKASGKAVYLCAKPECRHDGSEYCTATKKGVLYDGNICKNGEYVYYAASEYADKDEKTYFKLIRVKADGTEFTELCTFQTTMNDSIIHGISGENYGRSLAVHRGFAIVPFNDFSLPSLTADYTPNTMIIDIDSGNFKRLPTPDTDLAETKYGQGDYFLYDNWLYYTITMRQNDDRKLLYRYDLKSGITEKVDISEKFTSYAVTDRSILYSTPTDGEISSKLWKYDPESGVTEDISKQLMIDGKPFANANFLWNGEYLILWDEHYWQGSAAIAENHPDKIMIMDKGGNAVAVYDMHNAPIPVSSGGDLINYGLKSQNGKLYICTFLSQDDPRSGYDTNFQNLVLCCEISDIIDGNAQWYEPFDFYQLVKPKETDNA